MIEAVTQLDSLVQEELSKWKNLEMGHMEEEIGKEGVLINAR